MNMVLVAGFLVFSLAGSGLAQDWSKEQKAVWSSVEKYWEVAAKSDVDGFLSYFDESYIGWSYASKVPQNKANTSKWIRNDFANNKSVLYTITPISIWVKGDFAFVNYFYAQIEKNLKTEKETPSAGKWTDILMKKGDRWVLVGDHGGRTSKKQ